MKITLLFLIGYFCIQISFAQDFIYKNDGTEIKSIVVEITLETIKYKNFNQLDGPIRNIPINDIFMIVYHDGKREVFKKKEKINTTKDSLNKTFAYRNDMVLSFNQRIEKNPKLRFQFMSKIKLKNEKIILAKLWESENDSIIKCELKDGFIKKYPAKEISEIKTIKKRNYIGDIYGWITKYDWHEYDENNKELMNENGPISGLGFKYDNCIVKRFRFDFKFEFGGGNTNYEGQSWGGTTDKTNGKQLLMKTELNIKVKINTPNLLIEPYDGIGLRFWNRAFNNTTQNDTTIFGYEETWINLYNSLGLKGAVRITNSINCFFNAALKIPLYNSNTANPFERIPEVQNVVFKVNPGKRVTYYLESGCKIYKYRVTVFYENLNYSKSQVVTKTIQSMDSQNSTSVGIFQPESKASIWGICLGYSF